tara:strand:- start:1113 stop:1931 length:819 start_codon:yes stop_codon:yes gene_type:complete
MIKSNNCQNCGLRGHHIRDCIQPKTSLGIILFKKNVNKIKYLMVRRRNSIGFVEFIRGRYAFNDINYIQKLFNVMIDNEINLILNNNFDFLWEHLWLDKKFKKNSDKLKKDYEYAFKKFLKIKKGYMNKNYNISIDIFISNKIEKYKEQEWGFPKGRRNIHENDLEAALRELEEETNIKKNEIKLFTKNNLKFIEDYKSYDNVNYRNIYFLGEYHGDSIFFIDKSKKEQFSEISKISFLGLNECLSTIRNYSYQKKDVIKKVDNFIKLQIKN